MAEHNDLGKQGENIAIDYLRGNGYQILETNYRYQKAEVDIMALKDKTLAIVEVKTRSTAVFGNPQDFLKRNQIERIVNAVDYYIQSQQLDVEVRFDVIAIVKTDKAHEVQHLENAYYHF